jgi:hypothetical protein
MSPAQLFRSCSYVLAIGLFAEIAASAPLTYEQDDAFGSSRKDLLIDDTGQSRMFQPTMDATRSMFAISESGAYLNHEQIRPSLEFAYAFVRDERANAARTHSMVNGRFDAYSAEPPTQFGVLPTAIPILALGLALFGLLARRHSDEGASEQARPSRNSDQSHQAREA